MHFIVNKIDQCVLPLYHLKMYKIVGWNKTGVSLQKKSCYWVVGVFLGGDLFIYLFFGFVLFLFFFVRKERAIKVVTDRTEIHFWQTYGYMCAIHLYQSIKVSATYAIRSSDLPTSKAPELKYRPEVQTGSN